MANLFKRYESESYPGQWSVVCEDEVENPRCYGWGHSLKEAREQWGEMIVERLYDHLDAMKDAGEIDLTTASMARTDLDGIAWLPF